MANGNHPGRRPRYTMQEDLALLDRVYTGIEALYPRGLPEDLDNLRLPNVTEITTELAQLPGSLRTQISLYTRWNESMRPLIGDPVRMCATYPDSLFARELVRIGRSGSGPVSLLPNAGPARRPPPLPGSGSTGAAAVRNGASSLLAADAGGGDNVDDDMDDEDIQSLPPPPRPASSSPSIAVIVSAVAVPSRRRRPRPSSPLLSDPVQLDGGDGFPAAFDAGRTVDRDQLGQILLPPPPPPAQPAPDHAEGVDLNQLRGGFMPLARGRGRGRGRGGGSIFGRIPAAGNSLAASSTTIATTTVVATTATATATTTTPEAAAAPTKRSYSSTINEYGRRVVTISSSTEEDDDEEPVDKDDDRDHELSDQVEDIAELSPPPVIKAKGTKRLDLAPAVPAVPAIALVVHAAAAAVPTDVASVPTVVAAIPTTAAVIHQGHVGQGRVFNSREGRRGGGRHPQHSRKRRHPQDDGSDHGSSSSSHVESNSDDAVPKAGASRPGPPSPKSSPPRPPPMPDSPEQISPTPTRKRRRIIPGSASSSSPHEQHQQQRPLSPPARQPTWDRAAAVEPLHPPPSSATTVALSPAPRSPQPPPSPHSPPALPPVPSVLTIAAPDALNMTTPVPYATWLNRISTETHHARAAVHAMFRACSAHRARTERVLRNQCSAADRRAWVWTADEDALVRDLYKLNNGDQGDEDDPFVRARRAAHAKGGALYAALAEVKGGEAAIRGRAAVLRALDQAR